MLLLLPLFTPVLLLLLLLVMERVERPLRNDALGDQIDAYLESRLPDEVEDFVRDGFASALERYWRRRRTTRLLAERLGIPG